MEEDTNVIGGTESIVDSTDSSSDVTDDTQSTDDTVTDDGDPDLDTSAEPEAGDDDPESGTGPDGQQTLEDGRVIPPWIRALKESNPEAFKKAKTDLFELKDRRAVHATAQVAREEHQLVQSLGGTKGVATLRQDAGTFKDAATQFMKGDAAFVKDLFDTDPIAASLHVPHMLTALKQADPAAYQTTIAQLWDKEFQAVGFVEHGLKPLKAAIESGDKAAAARILDSIVSWQESLSAKARQAEDPRMKALLAERAKAHETTRETEQKAFLDDYKKETTQGIYDSAAKVFDSHFKNRKLSTDDKRDLMNEVLRYANAEVMQDKEYIQQQNDHLVAGDKLSAQRITNARYGRAIPDAVKKVARRYGLVSGKPGAGTPPAKVNNTPGKTPPKGGPAPGYIAVNARPSAEQIDWTRTTREDIFAGKAVQRDGRKVDWSKLQKRTTA